MIEGTESGKLAKRAILSSFFMSKITHQNLALGFSRDLVAELLADKRSPGTRRAYARDLRDFFEAVAGREATPDLVAQFLSMDRFDAVALVLRYKQLLIEKGLAENTVNRRLAAIRSLVNYARAVGKCSFTLSDVKGEPIQAYRDTTGIEPDAFRAMLATCNRSTLKGKRDYSILRLLWDNALRRAEVSNCDIKDLDIEAKTLWILGKGRGTQKVVITLSPQTIAALQDWLCDRRETRLDAPLFIALDRAYKGHRLTGTAIYDVVSNAAKTAGISKQLSPHRIRHSSVTAALEATGGDVRQVQKLSRHKKLDTLMIYDDNRANVQGAVTNVLADLV